MIKPSQSTQSNKIAISLQYLEKEVGDEVHFLQADKYQSFYKLELSVLVEVARHVRSTQNRKLVIFFNILKKYDDVYADKHESFLQVDTIILGVFDQTKFYTCNEKF